VSHKTSTPYIQCLIRLSQTMQIIGNCVLTSFKLVLLSLCNYYRLISEELTLRSSNLRTKSKISANCLNSACCFSRCSLAVISAEHKACSSNGTLFSVNIQQLFINILWQVKANISIYKFIC